MGRNFNIKTGGIVMSNELKHYGVLGMKWGKRKAQKTTGPTNTKKGKEVDWKRVNRMLNIGSSVAVGLLSSGFGASGIYALTGSQIAATIAAPSLGVLGGLKYYEWMSKLDEQNNK